MNQDTQAQLQPTCREIQMHHTYDCSLPEHFNSHTNNHIQPQASPLHIHLQCDEM
jgi:hypothetical protein